MSPPSAAAAMAAAAAAGGAGPGGGGRRGARTVPTNILAQLRHGQLSGCGLTRGAQVRAAALWRGEAALAVPEARGAAGARRGLAGNGGALLGAPVGP